MKYVIGEIKKLFPGNFESDERVYFELGKHLLDKGYSTSSPANPLIGKIGDNLEFKVGFTTKGGFKKETTTEMHAEVRGNEIDFNTQSVTARFLELLAQYTPIVILEQAETGG